MGGSRAMETGRDFGGIGESERRFSCACARRGDV
jgi:hypothetical protein